MSATPAASTPTPTPTPTTTTSLLANPPAGFARRVSFDNYACPTLPLTTSNPSRTLPRPSTPATPATPAVAPTPSILKNRGGDEAAESNPNSNRKPRSVVGASAASSRDPGVTPLTDNNLTAHNTNISRSAESSIPGSSSDNNSNTCPTTQSKNVFPNNYTLQSTTTNPITNSRKKSYQDLSDSELLALDSQYNFKSVDIQKSYGFAPTSRLPYTTISDCDKITLNRGENHNFKNLSPNAILKEYPTKPIITKNSICINFKHNNLLNNESNNKFHLILLSKKSASLASLNYYMNKISSKGDTIVICCSLSTSILGNEKSKQLEEFITNFTQTILSYLQKNKYPINITFEFFKSYSYIDQVLELYQPSLIIVGTNNDSTKSTSLTTSEKKLISLVYVGNDQLNESIITSHRQSEISFKLPNRPSNIKSPNSSSTDIAIADTDDDEDNNNSSPLSKQKTNDTIVSSLFDNLNDTPALNSLSTSTDTLTGRRKSFLDEEIDPLTYDSLSKLQLPPLIRNRSSGNAAADNQLKDRQQLFEKYNRRLSQVNVDPKKSTPAGQAEKPKKSGFFSKLFSK
ncbi:hypothetical protein CANINC_000374 [Pichia inconspicua]|uniref:Uncharacterized protein n=1 Tax=Pichia inconspicua TaxID=52247 RepID=A0A4T0X6P4_9ASCO|nr:hypothetical protein CANINC_000374 [[Candida] inconspicua]